MCQNDGKMFYDDKFKFLERIFLSWKLPFSTAEWSGVSPNLFFAFTSALLSIKSFVTSLCADVFNEK